MVFNHTARYYRSKVSDNPVRSKRTIWPLRKPKPKLSVYSRNPELNDLLKRIFHSNTFEDDVSSQPVLNFLVFEYSFYDGKLTLSLSMKGNIIDLIEIIEEKEIIEAFKTLSRKKIPHWIGRLLKRFKLIFPYDVCLTNISVTDGESNLDSTFCLLLKPKRTKKKTVTNLDSEVNEVRNQVESHLVPIQSQASSNQSPFLMPNQQSCPMIVEEEIIVDPSPQNISVDPPAQDVSVDRPPQDVVVDPPPQDVVVDPPPQDVVVPPPQDPEKKLEADFKSFLKGRRIMNEAFLYHHDKQGKFASSIYFVFSENGKTAIYLMKEVCHVERMIMYLKDCEKSEISHLKIQEFQEDNREDLNDYLLLLFQEVVSGSTYFNLQYTWFSLEHIHVVDVMELNVIYVDGKQYQYVNGKKYEFPFDREYFRSKEIARIGDVSLTWRSLLTLSPHTWLNDVIIDAYLNLIAERSKGYLPPLPSVYVFNSYFLKRLQSNRVQPEKFSGDILKADVLFMPANISNTHWALYVVDHRSRTILYFDSLNYAYPDLFFLIEDFLNKVAVRHPQSSRHTLPLDYFKGSGLARQQDNDSDCGLFLLKHADCLSRNLPFNFSQKDMPLFREQVMHELFNQKLSKEKPPKSENVPPMQGTPMCRIGDTSLTLDSLLSVSMPCWLDEIVVDAYLNLIALRAKQYSYIFPSVFVFDTNFIPALQCGKVQFGKYTVADILKFDMLFIPFHFYGQHWTLFCVNNRTKTILCYDSWRINDSACMRVINWIEKFLKEIAISRKVLDLKNLQYQKGFGDAVNQTQSEECGVLLLMHAEYLSRHEKFNFSENEMLDIRTQVLYELSVQKLSSPLPDIRPPRFPEIPSNIEIGLTNDKFQTLTFNFALGDIVIESYMLFLKKRPSVWVYPDQPNDSKNILLFPFKNKKGWALVAIDRCAKVLNYFNIPSSGEIVENLRLIRLFDRSLVMSDFTHVELPFPKDVVDSGVYVLATSYCMAEGIPISFDDRHVAYLRKKIYFDLKSVEYSAVASGSSKA